MHSASAHMCQMSPKQILLCLLSCRKAGFKISAKSVDEQSRYWVCTVHASSVRAYTCLQPNVNQTKLIVVVVIVGVIFVVVVADLRS